MTHYAMMTPSQEYGVLYRVENGMRVAIWHNQAVIFGINPNRGEGRAFMTPDLARLWMIGECADEDNKLQGRDTKAVVEIKSTEGAIILPQGSLEFDLDIHKRKFN